MSNFFRFLFPVFGRDEAEAQEQRELALHVETLARRLNGDVPAVRPPDAPRDLRSILHTAALLLERRDLHQRAGPPSPPAGTAPAEVRTPAPPAAAAPTEVRTPPPPPAAAPAQPEPPVRAPAQEAPLDAPGAGPFASVDELIRLRDWVLVASGGEEQPPRQVLSAVYRRLGKVLEREGLTSLEQAGPYDEECQEVVATQATADAEQHHRVAESVRPGYRLAGGDVLRPQQVVVYVFEPAAAPA